MAKRFAYLKFRCTGCGACCREPLLPLTDDDVARISQRTGEPAQQIVRWVDRDGIDLDDEPEAFVRLRQGKRVMVMRQAHGRCRYLGADERCSIYTSRPLGCRVFPLSPTFTVSGKLSRLGLIRITDCPYELDGNLGAATLRSLYALYDGKRTEYHQKVAHWNRLQLGRRRQGSPAQAASVFLQFLGLPTGAASRAPGAG
ncbi:MAG: YkgJ family cysteine cluster protein [Polyangiaceae bacterium]|nr:YkgJ family cysteine cluster protein [Polyangiaceae bacterium]